ncbi:MAG: hypothetical protein WBV22_09720, partial [Anaerolineaceae bacterium]
IISAIWDTNKDAREFYDAFNQYGIARLGTPSSQSGSVTNWQSGSQSVRIKYETPRTLIVIAPDSITLDLVIQTLNVK